MEILKEILEARNAIKGKVDKTPLIYLKDFELRSYFSLYLKLESLQKTGSFKIRGVFNKLNHLTKEERNNGVIAFSAGSHALSLAFASSELNIPCWIVVPKGISSDKLDIMKNYGAKVILVDNNDLLRTCMSVQNQKKLILVHPFDDPWIIAGQGTIGCEILEDLPNVDMVFVPIGGGGLISGMAIAIKSRNPKVKIIGVEPTGAPSMFKSINNNRISYLKTCDTIAECLRAPYIGKYTFKYAKKYVDDFVLVSDKEIVETLRKIWQISKIKVEPSSAVSLAAIIFKKVKIPQGSRIVSILTGGNISNERFRKILKNVS